MGDTDLRLHRADPSLMHDFMLATQSAGTSIMLLHCYPHHRQAAILSLIFPHVYMDVGEALNYVGARARVVLAEALEVTPFHKMLYSSDAFGLAELHYLGAAGFRRDLAKVTGRVRGRRGLVGGGRRPGRAADRVGERPPRVPPARLTVLASGGRPPDPRVPSARAGKPAVASGPAYGVAGAGRGR